MSLLSSIKDSFSTLAENAKFEWTEHGSTVMLIGGIVLGVGAIVTACVATRKVDDILEDAEDEMELIEEEFRTEETEDGEKHELSKEEKRELSKSRLKAKGRLVWKLIRTYALAALLFGASMFCFCKCHSIDVDNYAKVVAAYNVLDQSFKQYRKNVIAAEGAEKDLQYRMGFTNEEMEEVKSGNMSPETKAKVSKIGKYARFFDELCPDWKENPNANIMFLNAQEAYANQKLRSRYRKPSPIYPAGRPGWVFLNEVYEWLGYDITEEGQKVGWLYDPVHPIGDNYIDFGINNELDLNVRFLQGIEPVALLDFNVDGIISTNRAVFDPV